MCIVYKNSKIDWFWSRSSLDVPFLSYLKACQKKEENSWRNGLLFCWLMLTLAVSQGVLSRGICCLSNTEKTEELKSAGVLNDLTQWIRFFSTILSNWRKTTSILLSVGQQDLARLSVFVPKGHPFSQSLFTNSFHQIFVQFFLKLFAAWCLLPLFLEHVVLPPSSDNNLRETGVLH